MALGTGLSFQYWDTTANKTKRIAVDDSVTTNVGRFYQAQVRQLYTGGNGALNIKSNEDDDLAVFNDDGTVSIGVSGQDTTIAGNLVVAGSVTFNGTPTIVTSTEVNIGDNIIFVNSGPSATKNAGYATERYQTANEAGSGDVVSDSAALVVSLSDIGDQTGMSSTQITLTGGSSTNDYYVGMWIKTAFGDGQNVRKITAYNGTTKVATVATAWDTQPSSNSAVGIYSPFTGMVFDETNNRWVSALLAGSSASNAILSAVGLEAGLVRANGGVLIGSGQKVYTSSGDLVVTGGFGGGTLSLRSNGGSSADGIDITHSSGIQVYKNFIPSSDSSYSLGSSSAAWSNVYADTITSLTANGYVQIGSSTVALRLPNLDDTAQGALAAVAAGCLVWNTTDEEIQVYDGSAWVAVGGGGDPAQASTTSLTWTVNSDETGAADQDAALVLISGDGSSNVDTGTLTYVFGADGSDGGVWSFAADVRIADGKHLYIGNDDDIAASWDGDDLVLNVAGGLNADFTAPVAFDSTSGISIDAGGASNFSTTAADLTISTLTSGTLAVTSAGALNLSSTSGDWQASGALTIDSSGGAISIGGDADAQAINIGTGSAARTITFGNTTGATALVFNAGTGLLDFNASVKMAFGSDFAFDGFTIDGGLASGEFAYISGNNTLSEATAASGGHCELIEGVYNGTGLVVSGPVNIKKPSGETWAAGDRVFVNNAASGGTTTAPSASGTDVREIGRVMNAAGNGTTTARILLDLTKDTVGNP